MPKSGDSAPLKTKGSLVSDTEKWEIGLYLHLLAASWVNWASLSFGQIKPSPELRLKFSSLDPKSHSLSVYSYFRPFILRSTLRCLSSIPASASVVYNSPLPPLARTENHQAGLCCLGQRHWRNPCCQQVSWPLGNFLGFGSTFKWFYIFQVFL